MVELNPKVPIIIALFLIIFCLTGIPFKIAKDIISPPKIVNTTPNITYVTVYKTVLVTPTPDGKTYFADEYQNGTRKINRPFSFYREDASGLKDLSVHTTVYRYRVMNSYHWFNPQDYKYYIETPSSPDKKFLFVFIQSYMDDIIGDDPRMWYFDEKHFAVQYQNVLYYPIPFEKQIRIKELEETFNLNDDSRVQYYSTLKYYRSGHPETAGETYENLTYLRGGQSNALDGYLIYEIPKDARDEDLLVVASFNAFGYASWVLKPLEVTPTITPIETFTNEEFIEVHS